MVRLQNNRLSSCPLYCRCSRGLVCVWRVPWAGLIADLRKGCHKCWPCLNFPTNQHCSYAGHVSCQSYSSVALIRKGIGPGTYLREMLRTGAAEPGAQAAGIGTAGAIPGHGRLGSGFSPVSGHFPLCAQVAADNCCRPADDACFHLD